ncbi:MAG: MFS transporter [Elusimicrobia bacterium]|nr:MFS transporter [Elusimicrobiota bacterium]
MGPAPRACSLKAADRALIYAAATLRSAGVGFASAVLAIYLDKRGYTALSIGAIMAAGLGGGAVATGCVALLADRLGRRRVLTALAVLGLAGGLGLAWAPGVAAAAFAFIGMVNGMGHDRGGAYALEQSALSAAGSVEERTRLFAGYHAAGDVGCACGSLAAALVPWLGYQTLWTLYACAVGAGLLLYPGLSEGVELVEPSRPVSPESRRRVARFAALSAVDSFGSGFITAALIAFYLYKRFGINERQIAGLFLAADLANIASNFIAERLSRWLGLVNTMVFTHIPANLLLIALAFCPTFPIAAAVFLLRELFIEMDVPTRQSYLASIVNPDERTAALGGVQLTRTAMWAVAPGAAGWLMRSVALASPLYIGSAIKIAYDVLLWRAFRHLKPVARNGAGH